MDFAIQMVVMGCITSEHWCRLSAFLVMSEPNNV